MTIGVKGVCRLPEQACYNAGHLRLPVYGIPIQSGNQGLALVHSLSVRLLMLLVLPLAGWANAGQKVDVYRADVLVKNQSEADRNAAARASFGGLVVRVSGQRNALDHPVIRQAQPKAQNYLFGFTYKSTAEQITEGENAFPALALQLNFDSRAIDQLLREAQLPLWPAVRPKVLVWLVYRDAAGLHQVPQLLDAQALRAQANYRGLPLAFPKLDLEDSLSLTSDDLWAVDVEKVKAASLRYKADAILIGRYTPTAMGAIPASVVVEASTVPSDASLPPVSSSPAISSVASLDEATDSAPQAQGPWVGDWQLIHSNNQEAFTDETPEVAGLFASAIDKAADYFARQYAIMPTDQGPQAIVLRVGNVTSFGAFKQVQSYLGELAMVQRMEVITVNQEGLLVRLTTEGDVRLLISTLALGRRMVPLQSESVGDAAVQSAVVGDAVHSSQDDSGIDAGAMAEFDQALANELQDNELQDGDDSDAALSIGPVHAGTQQDPLIYVWQK